MTRLCYEAFEVNLITEKKMRSIKFLVFVLIVLLISGKFMFSESHSNVIGKVIDEDTKKGVPGVWVRITNVIENDRYHTTRTDENGDFVLSNVMVMADWEYELEVKLNVVWKDVPSGDYFSQVYQTTFYMKERQNLYLEPFKIKRGIIIHGNLKYWDGTPILKGRLEINPLTPKVYDPLAVGWSMKLLDNGSFISEPVPFDEDLDIVARQLRDNQKGESYGRVLKRIRINKGETPGIIDVIIPDIETEIRGRIVDINNNPLEKQGVELTSDKHLAYAVTDENGYFILKHLEPGNLSVCFDYRKDVRYAKSYWTADFDLNPNESIRMDVSLGDDLFKYRISRKDYPDR
jgi:hypothetical protein